MIIELSMIVVIVFIVMVLSQKCCDTITGDKNTSFYERSSTLWMAVLAITLLLLLYLLMWVIPSPLGIDM